MDREAVRSSNIRSVGYDAAEQILEIEFIESGIYQYFNVPELVYQSFMRASSQGSYFSQNIKDRYRTKKVR